MARFGKLGWFLGLLFGTVFGVLFAPRKGKELRARMKKDRKEGRLGVAPLQDDLKYLGREIAGLAKDIYKSEGVQDLVEKGRKELKELSGDLVSEVSDFHYTRIKPLQDEVKTKVNFVKGRIAGGRATMKQAGRAKASVKIGKKAYRKIKKVVKKK